LLFRHERPIALSNVGAATQADGAQRLFSRFLLSIRHCRRYLPICRQTGKVVQMSLEMVRSRQKVRIKADESQQ
jgi:hypothetical protein